MYDLKLLGKSLEEFNKDVGILYDKIWASRGLRPPTKKLRGIYR